MNTERAVSDLILVTDYNYEAQFSLKSLVERVVNEVLSQHDKKLQQNNQQR